MSCEPGLRNESGIFGDFVIFLEYECEEKAKTGDGNRSLKVAARVAVRCSGAVPGS